MFKKVLKGIAIVLVSILIIGIAAFFVTYYQFIGRFEEDLDAYPHHIGHIDQSTALRNDIYTLCDSTTLYNLHSPRHLISYEGSKKQFRKSVKEQIDTTLSRDSGYINFRFIVNCKGEPGWFELRQTDLEFEYKAIDPTLTESLLDFTVKPEHWAIIDYGSGPVDYYMYVTYRIENGKVTEILP